MDANVTIHESLYQCILDCEEIEGATIEDKVRRSLSGVSDSLILAFVQAITASRLEQSCQAEQLSDILLKIFKFCVKKDFTDEDANGSVYFVLTKDILQKFVFYNKHHGETIRPFLPYVKQLWKGPNKILAEIAASIMNEITDGDLLGDSVTELIEDYLEGKGQIHLFPGMYPSSAEKFDPYMERFAERLSMDIKGWEKTFIISLFRTALTTNPKVTQIFTQKMIMLVSQTLDDKQADILAVTVLILLAPHKPAEIVKVLDKMIDFADEKGKTFMRPDIGGTIAMVTKEDKDFVEKYLKVLVRWTEEMEPDLRPAIVPHFKAMCAQHPQALRPYREFLEELKQDPGTKLTANWCLGFLEGESWYSCRMDEPESNLEETDEKPLSHAPSWTRDVALLLSPENDPDVSKTRNSKSEQDWVKLAKSLGYTDRDISIWVTQPNPCLSMFEEWFTRPRSREDIQIISNNLHKMKREDALCIVQFSLNRTVNVIHYTNITTTHQPPLVYISRHSNQKEKIQVLKKHLEMAGFECLMHIGHRGGEDEQNLTEANNDKYITGASVVVCCVTREYSVSTNCREEIELSVNEKKPIIPLLLEDISWPPSGLKGETFGEVPCIRLFKTEKDTSGDQCFWPSNNFKELLKWLRYYIPLKESHVYEGYKNWWKPREETNAALPIEGKNKENQNEETGKRDYPNDPKDPEVFISYNWGIKKDIRALYRRLSSCGINCWLDDFQMGGGDPLYKKIDAGIRGSKVVISCVTSKYVESENCGLEVLTAHSVKKTIIPLYLESIDWPPAGHMSLPLVKLVYIDFTTSDQNNLWNCKVMDKLLNRLKKQLPHMNWSPPEDFNEIEEVKEATTPTIKKVKKATTLTIKSRFCIVL